LDRRTKEQIVSELQKKLKEAKLGVLTSFSGMNVEKMETLRNALRKSDAEWKVVKNTLLRIAQKKPISVFLPIISNGLLPLFWAIKIR
jgi:large subunit ribosomal protein L10